MKKRFLLISIFLFLLCVSSKAQTDDLMTESRLAEITDSLVVWNIQKNTQKIEEAFRKHYQAFRLSQSGFTPLTQAKFINQYIDYQELKKPLEAKFKVIELCQEQLALSPLALSEDSLSMLQLTAMIAIAKSYRNTERQDSAMFYALKAYQYFEQLPSLTKTVSRYPQLLVLLGNLYSDRDEKVISIAYQKQALAIINEQGKFYNAYLVGYNLYGEYIQLGNFKEALASISTAQKNLELAQRKDSFLIIEVLILLSSAKYYTHDIAGSSTILEECTRLLKQTKLAAEDSIDLQLQILVGKARVSPELKETYLEEAYQLSKELKFNNPSLFRIPKIYLEHLLSLKKDEKAQAILQEMLPFMYLADGTLRSYSFALYFYSHLAYLSAKEFQRTGDTQILAKAKMYCQKVIGLERERTGSSKKHTSFELSSQSRDIHPSNFIVSALRQMFQTTTDDEELVQAIETFRANQMKSNRRKQELISQYHVDELMIAKQAEVHSQIAEIERDLSIHTLADSSTAKLHRALADLRKQQIDVDQRIRDAYPDFYRKVYTSDLLDTKKFCQTLHENQSVLVLGYSLDTVIGCIMDRAGVACKELGSSLVIDSLIDQLSASINEHPNVNHSDLVSDSLLEAYRVSAQKLYNYLIVPFEGRLNQQIVFVPERKLFKIPYGALLTKPTDANVALQNYPFLVRKHQISLIHSLELYQLQRDRAKKPILYTQTWAGLAPTTDNTTSAYYLPHSAVEVQDLASLMHGVALMGKDAHKLALLSLVQNTKMLHIATHTITQPNYDQSDYLLLANEHELTANEVAIWDIKSKLCFLSSCSSGSGLNTSQEGLQGLSRAFALAGVPCVVANLWSVEDRASILFTKKFYTELQSNHSTQECVQSAQLSFINSRTATAHPYYWAGYTSIGAANVKL